MCAFLKIIVFSVLCVIGFGQPDYENIVDKITSSYTGIEEWWGPIELLGYGSQNTSLYPFRIEFKEDMIKDLRDRINRRRNVTPPLDGIAFEYGFNTDHLDSWMNFWAKEYNFKDRENYLNKYPQFKTNVQGLNIHFLWVKPETEKYPDCVKEVVPLLLLHGWPGSVAEFYKAIPYLTSFPEHGDRDFQVEVIIPSLPGFGFSDGATRPGFGTVEAATIFKNLMLRLGFEKFYIQGGDFGAIIATDLVTLYPENVLGYHTNFAVSIAPATFATWLSGSINPLFKSLVVEPDLADRLYPIVEHLKGLTEEFGYLHMQATKPDTLGIAMADSPAGLLAYMFTEISVGSRIYYKYKNDGGLNDLYTKEELIDNLMFYWVNNAFTTSARIYAEYFNMRTINMGIFAIPTSVPTWSIHAKYEIIYQSPQMLKFKFTNLLNSTVLDDFGHFLAWERPDIFSDDVLRAISAFRKWDISPNRKDEL